MKSKTTTWVIIGAILLIVIIFVVIIMRRRRQEQARIAAAQNPQTANPYQQAGFGLGQFIGGLFTGGNSNLSNQFNNLSDAQQTQAQANYWAVTGAASIA